MTIFLNSEHSEKDHLKHRFNRAAASYDENAWLQISVAKKLFNLFKENNQHLVSAKFMVDLGCGTGKSTAIFSQLPHQLLIGLDIAADLISVANKNLTKTNAHTMLADFDFLPFHSESIDIVFANMVLHWSFNLKTSLREIHRALVPKGVLAFSIPIAGTFKQLINSLNILLNDGYEDHFSTLDNIMHDLKRNDFKILQIYQQQHVFYFKDIFSLLKNIKSVGATYKKNQQQIYIKSRKQLNELEKIFSDLYLEPEQGLPLSYNIASIIVQKENHI